MQRGDRRLPSSSFFVARFHVGRAALVDVVAHEIANALQGIAIGVDPSDRNAAHGKKMRDERIFPQRIGFVQMPKEMFRCCRK